ncbi:MAG: TIGR03984 family CRISPR-associated protein [Chloroflexi bacterium]|nr:TIGR03984 family CRISPR-associated protein [Chloroflexota bacterium]
MTRTRGEGKVTFNYPQPPEKGKAIGEWLTTQAEGYTETFYLLAHADDGVIWGRLSGGKLVTAPVSPALNDETLQNARLFSKGIEIYLWRDGDGNFQARSIKDGEGNARQYFDEAQILWGTHSEPTQGGFTLMSDGAQGLRHSVPIEVKAHGRGRPLRLKLRHYLDEDDKGFVRVAYSRLVDLTAND